MLNGYEIGMLLMIGASFVFMMLRLIRALEQEKREKAEQRRSETSSPRTSSAPEQDSNLDAKPPEIRSHDREI
ncbi:hypothetical protein QWY20_18245 [Alkalimonas sp. MEB108]|uniref:Uncharacterized protein n=1 Tax=Alkalimonas cellulosilytica TaxID=3058395 RepID=A0ABU7JB11_9GAMM|nr:hypothetical protein [Alkalimonas sp. MEB108]MEE2003390.1 hypothetical protein [Alkalimonas sp. MEB108]